MQPLNWQHALNWAEISWWTQNLSKSRNFCLKPSADRQIFQSQPPRDPVHQGHAGGARAGTHWHARGYRRTHEALQALNPDKKKSTTLVKKEKKSESCHAWTLPHQIIPTTARAACCWEQTRHCRDGEGWDSVWVTQRTGETWRAQTAEVLCSTEGIPQGHKYRQVCI